MSFINFFDNNFHYKTCSWNSYVNDCSINYESRLDKLFRDEFFGKIVSWNGTVHSIDGNNAFIVPFFKTQNSKKPEIVIFNYKTLSNSANFVNGAQIDFTGKLRSFGWLFY